MANVTSIIRSWQLHGKCRHSAITRDQHFSQLHFRRFPTKIWPVRKFTTTHFPLIYNAVICTALSVCFTNKLPLIQLNLIQLNAMREACWPGRQPKSPNRALSICQRFFWRLWLIGESKRQSWRQHLSASAIRAIQQGMTNILVDKAEGQPRQLPIRLREKS